MRKCKNEECLRELDENEIEYCISCKSQNDSKLKNIVSIVTTVGIVVGGIVKFIRRFKK